ncbi:MAG: DUF3467 domain-containing protein [Myxococcales bacterium]|nr:DUF3467 domain-containing protein [Myxococcales bacterium]
MTEDKLPKKPAVKMEIKVDEAVAGGTYANLCIVNHSDSEFVLDFVFIQPGRPKTKVSSRIIMSPKNAKRTLMLLDQQIKNYEKRFGKLEIAAPMAMPGPEMEVN